MSEEEWRLVPSLGDVMASSWGRILLPNRFAKMPNGGVREYKTKPRYGTLTKSSSSANHVYMGLLSRKHGNIKVHRAVCEAFHGPPPEGMNNVLHLDEDGTNNRPENLSWGTQKENLNAPGFIEYCKSRTGKNNPRAKAKSKGENE